MPQPITWTVGPQRWRVHPELTTADGTACVLLGPNGLRLAEWLADGTAQVAKQAPHRAIYRVRLPGLDLFLKEYPRHGGKSWLRRLLRGNKAVGEYDRALAVAARGVPTVEPLAVGETVEGRGADYLVTRTLPDVRPLNAFLESTLPTLPPERQTCLRQRLARRLGELLARMHDGGVRHDDLHPGNLLLRLDGDEPTLYLVDLHAVRLGAPLGEAARRDNLAVLNRWFALRAGRTDRLRFWHAYDAARRQPLGARRVTAAARAIEEATLSSNLRFWAQRDRHCLGDNRYFRRARAPGVTGHVVGDFDAALLERFLADPDAAFGWPNVRVLKHSRSSTVAALEVGWNGARRRVIYKRFAVTRRSDPWAALLRPTAALRSFVLGHGLRRRGLPTPRPLGVWHRRRYGLSWEGYLLVDEVPDAVDLGAHVARLAASAGGASRRRLRGLIEQAARLAARLHQRGLSHRDLKAPNLLVSPALWSPTLPERPEVGAAAAAGGADQLWLVDLVGVRRLDRVPHRRRLRDLARLAVSFVGQAALTSADRLRFLRGYLGWGLSGRLGWPRWWRALAAAVAAKVERNRRRGRPLG